MSPEEKMDIWAIIEKHVKRADYMNKNGPELTQEVETLRQDLDDALDLNAFKDVIKKRCADKATQYQSTDKSIPVPQTPVQKMYWEVVEHLFAPKNLTDQLAIFHPNFSITPQELKKALLAHDSDGRPFAWALEMNPSTIFDLALANLSQDDLLEVLSAKYRDHSISTLLLGHRRQQFINYLSQIPENERATFLLNNLNEAMFLEKLLRDSPRHQVMSVRDFVKAVIESIPEPERYEFLLNSNWYKPLLSSIVGHFRSRFLAILEDILWLLPKKDRLRALSELKGSDDAPPAKHYLKDSFSLFHEHVLRITPPSRGEALLDKENSIVGILFEEMFIQQRLNSELCKQLTKLLEPAILPQVDFPAVYQQLSKENQENRDFWLLSETHSILSNFPKWEDYKVLYQDLVDIALSKGDTDRLRAILKNIPENERCSVLSDNQLFADYLYEGGRVDFLEELPANQETLDLSINLIFRHNSDDAVCDISTILYQKYKEDSWFEKICNAFPPDYNKLQIIAKNILDMEHENEENRVSQTPFKIEEVNSLTFLKAAVELATDRYKIFHGKTYDSNAAKYRRFDFFARGYEHGRWSGFRHGQGGIERADELNKSINDTESVDDFIKLLEAHLKKAPLHCHSYASYVLDEMLLVMRLAGVSTSGLKSDDTNKNRYNRKQVVEFITQLNALNNDKPFETAGVS